MFKPSILIELDKPRNLRFITNALVKLEESLGITLTQLIKKMANPDDLGIKELRNLLWAGLIHEEPQLTISEIEKIMDECEVDYTELGRKIGEAFALGVFAKKKQKAVKQEKQNGTGKNSTTTQ